MEFEKILSLYDYDLPEELIAKTPVKPRDSARVLVYNRTTDKISEDIFRNITKHLPARSVLVFNETKVLPARLELKKETGGAVKILFLGISGDMIRVMADKPMRPGMKLILKDKNSFLVQRRDKRFWLLRPLFAVGNIYEIFEKYGTMPIPPYIKNSPLSEAELKKEYQTVFAKNLGSVAAPTAALHFTNRLLNKIKRAGHEIIFITLHVNLGTFAPLTEDNFKTGRLHSEYYEVGRRAAARLNAAKARGQKIIAVGTTSLRALESATKNYKIVNLKGITDIFIHDFNHSLIRANKRMRPARPARSVRFVDGLITNFHVPKSSLMMLVAALIGREKLLEL
ncbi:MAG: tRNA preQ1(34) S-adenosylmethionine ribosyltransferase-isomerase QueA, partial [Patescibacteria group bacterium]